MIVAVVVFLLFGPEGATMHLVQNCPPQVYLRTMVMIVLSGLKMKAAVLMKIFINQFLGVLYGLIMFYLKSRTATVCGTMMNGETHAPIHTTTPMKPSTISCQLHQHNI